MFRKPRPWLTIVGKRRITFNGQTIPYTVKRSPRAKYVRLEMKRESGFTVVIPRSYDLGSLPDLLQAKRRWILGNLAGCSETRHPSAGGGLKSGDTVHYLGQGLELVVRRNSSKSNSVRLAEGRLVVSLGDADWGLNVALEQWYRMQAAKLITAKVDELSARFGVVYQRLTIRGQRTRWGSCSQKGSLSFNWKLMMAPEPVIDYVVIHEIAHLEEMNHGKGFWNLVAEHCPRWREHRRWLKEHEADLAAGLSP